MKIRILSFANIREIIGEKHHEISANGNNSISDIIDILVKAFPDLEEYFGENTGVMVAVNGNEVIRVDYSTYILQENDEFALIPPAGGG